MKHSGVSPPTARQTIIINVEATRLSWVSTRNFMEFKRTRELYENEVQREDKEPGMQVVPTSLRAFIDDACLHIFITVG